MQGMNARFERSDMANNVHAFPAGSPQFPPQWERDHIEGLTEIGMNLEEIT